MVELEGGIEIAAAGGLGGLEEEIIGFSEAEVFEPEGGFFRVFGAAEGVEDDDVELPCFGIVGVLGEGGFCGMEGFWEAPGLDGVYGLVVGFDGGLGHGVGRGGFAGGG